MVTAEIQTVNIAYFQRKIELSGFSAYPYGSPSHLFRKSGLLLYFIWWQMNIPPVGLSVYCTGLFEMIVEVLTTRHTQYT